MELVGAGGGGVAVEGEFGVGEGGGEELAEAGGDGVLEGGLDVGGDGGEGGDAAGEDVAGAVGGADASGEGGSEVEVAVVLGVGSGVGGGTGGVEGEVLEEGKGFRREVEGGVVLELGVDLVEEGFEAEIPAFEAGEGGVHGRFLGEDGGGNAPAVREDYGFLARALWRRRERRAGGEERRPEKVAAGKAGERRSSRR